MLPANPFFTAYRSEEGRPRGPQVSLEQPRCGSAAWQLPCRPHRGSACVHRKGGTIPDMKDLQPWQTLVTGGSVVCHLSSAV